MSGVEAISMACNVMTVISFSLETIKLYRNIHEAGSPDPELAKNAEHIRKASAKVKRLLHEQQQLDPSQRAMTTDAEKRLRDIASECLEYSKDIQQEIASTSPRKPGILRALKSTMKTMWRKSDRDQLKGHLQASQSTMDTAINVQILEQCIASGNLSREIYDRLDSEERKFIASYERRSQAVEGLIKQLHGHITEEHIATRGHNTKEHATTRETFAKTMGVIETNNRQEQACEKLLQSLSYPRMNERKNAIPEKHDGTFEWVFEGLGPSQYSTSVSNPENRSFLGTDSDTDWRDPEYSEKHDRREKVAEAKRNQAKADLLGWLQGHRSGTFWISGKPGSGKSTFTKFIMSDERTIVSLSKWRSRPEIITHFFWKPGTLLQQNFHGLLCSLLHQLLSIDVDVCAQLLRKTPDLRQKHAETDWDMAELKRHLLTTFRSSNRSYLILLDGLDEMAKPHRGLRELFDFLDILTKETTVKLCLSSRPEKIFVDRFSSYQRLRMHDVNFKDICDFTTEFLEGLGLEAQDQMRHLIAHEILAKADGVFIWVHLVLQNVRNGIEELDEDWDDIYHRILELPPDLMKLYNDMWSRLDQTKETYVEMAALYFQITRWGGDYLTLASLAVASDNAILERFTEQDIVPTPMELVKRCSHVSKTLFAICGGLLETTISFSDLFPNRSKTGSHDDHGDLSLLQDNDIGDLYLSVEKWDSEAAYVRFTHRSAIDFLDSADGHKLFGKYATTYEAIHSRITNAAIVLGCTPYHRDYPHQVITRVLGMLGHCSQFSDREYDLFCRAHRHAHMIAGVSSPPPSFSSHDYFIFIASNYMYYDFVTRFLRLEGDNCATTAAAALVGISVGNFAHDNNEHESERYRFMQMCIDYLRPGQVMSKASDLDDSSRFLIAWRCFLLSKLSDTLDGHPRREEDTLAVIESFISAGVLQRQPPPRYLVMIISMDSYYLVVLPSQRQFAEEGGSYIQFVNTSPILLFEVDDTFILQQLCNRMFKKSEFIISVLQAMGHSIVSPVLLWNKGQNRDVFTCTLKNQEYEKEFVDWAFEGCTPQGEEEEGEEEEGEEEEGEEEEGEEEEGEEEEGEEEEGFPEGAPDYLELVHLGSYEDYFEALEDIGYPLPDINRKHVCWNFY